VVPPSLTREESDSVVPPSVIHEKSDSVVPPSVIQEEIDDGGLPTESTKKSHLNDQCTLGDNTTRTGKGT